MALDPRIRLLMWLASKTGRTFHPEVSVAAMRAGYVQTNTRYGIKPVAEIETRELTIPTSDGATIGARLYRRVADAGRTLPVLLYFHGGGWVIGDVDSYDGLTRYFACEGRIAVISVAYRLGPEHRFPRGHEDALDAYAWLLENGASLGIDVARSAVGGDSAGGGLAASIAAEAEPRGLARPAFSLLIYPSVDGTARFRSRLQYTAGVPLTPATVTWFRDQSTNGPADWSMPLLVPLDAPHPERLPPTYVLAAQYDPLVDEGRAYYERLRAAGVPVTYDLRPTLAHGFVNLAGIVPEAKRALRDAIHATASALERTPSSVRLDADVIIVGAGFGGLGMAMQLKRAGRPSFLILERASDVGGTWRDNTYPGCACDVPAMLYSFSFGGERDWTRLYPQQPELLAYLQRTVASEDLAARIRFNSDLAEARFDEASGTWSLQLRDGTTLRCRVVISAMGPLNKPKFPTIAGRERFAGRSFHSSQWDHTVDLQGKQVVVIGTGASAIQFVPQIAPRVAQLTVVQRTPPWIIPRKDSAVSSRRALARKRVPFYAWLVRQAIYWTLELRALGFVVNPKLLAAQEAGIRASVERRVRDPKLRAKLIPTYRAGCKRILISDDYYPALERPNVELVTEAVTEIRPHAIVLRDGREVPADVIIYGTGFEATTGFTPVRVVGRAGIEIGDAWRDGMEAYLGTSIAGFPNLFLVIGPNTGLGHNSMVLMMEAQYRYIIGALAYLVRARAAWIDVKREVQTAFNREIQTRMRGTVWATGCSSWYQDVRGKNVSLWPGFTFAFRNRTARFDPSRYTSRTAEAER